MTISDSEPILEADEYCVVCLEVLRLGICELPGGLRLTVCERCHDGPKLREWLEREMERFLDESPDYERLPNGNFRRIKQRSSSTHPRR